MQVRSRRRRVQPVVGEKESLGSLDTPLEELYAKRQHLATPTALSINCPRRPQPQTLLRCEPKSSPGAEHHINLTYSNLHRLLHATSE